MNPRSKKRPRKEASAAQTRMSVSGAPPRLPRMASRRTAPSAVSRSPDQPLTLESAQELNFAEVVKHVETLTALYKQETSEAGNLIFFDQWRNADTEKARIENAARLRDGILALESVLRDFVEVVRRRRQQLDRVLQ